MLQSAKCQEVWDDGRKTTLLPKVALPASHVTEKLFNLTVSQFFSWKWGKLSHRLGFGGSYCPVHAAGGSVVKNLSAVLGREEMSVWSLGQEDALKEGVTTHSRILAWRIPWQEEPGGLQSMGLQSWTWLND